jgi:hypothetical protein
MKTLEDMIREIIRDEIKASLPKKEEEKPDCLHNNRKEYLLPDSMEKAEFYCYDCGEKGIIDTITGEMRAE